MNFRSEHREASGVPNVTVIVITRNEAHQIRECLESTRGIANEWIIVDTMSTDETVEIARDFGAKVVQSPDWPGYGQQKNKALSFATGDWVLSLDADERLTQDLVNEIRFALTNESISAWTIPRLSSYCGRFLRHGGWYPDYVLRLFKRGTAKFTNDTVHEKLVAEGRVGRLTHPILHYSFKDFSEVLDKVDRYSSLSATALYQKGKRVNPLHAITHGGWAFLRTYFIRFGFLDGAFGLAMAISNAEGTYYRYMKLWLLSKENDES